MKPSTKTSSIVALFCMTLLFSLFIGCSDDPVGGISGTGKTGRVLTTGIIVGQIDSMNKLTIDGIAFDATGSEVIINGNPAAIEELRVGMAIAAEVDYDKKSASYIEFQPLIAGPVESTSEDKTTVVVLGQEITISEQTYLDNLTVEDIFQDNVIEVSGARNKSGVLIAEYIRVPTLTENYFVVGQLNEISDELDASFIAGTNVDLSPVLSGLDVNATGHPNGSTVKAFLDSMLNHPAGNSHKATSAKVMSDIKLKKLQKAVIKGIVSNVYDTNHFALKKFIVSVNSDTEYQDGNGNVISPTTILANQKLKVTGVSSGDRTIVATVIELN